LLIQEKGDFLKELKPNFSLTTPEKLGFLYLYFLNVLNPRFAGGTPKKAKDDCSTNLPLYRKEKLPIQKLTVIFALFLNCTILIVQ
jgi:hypothetical protein